MLKYPRINIRFINTLFLIIFLIPFNNLFSQADPVSGFTPRLLTRAKLWGTFRNNGLQGGGNTPR